MNLTYSKFYYGFKVTEENRMLGFREGGAPLLAELNLGTYTLQGIVDEVARAMNSVGSQVYSVAAKRRTRKVTIEAEENFELLTKSGPSEFGSIFSLLGFSVDFDHDNSNTYVGEGACGMEYSPQIPLQSYLPTSVNKKHVYGTKKKTSTGIVEAITFGMESQMECELMFITDNAQPADSVIRSNPEGIKAATDFLDYAISQGEVEFMYDENDLNSYEVLLLESTEFDQNGLGYKLREDYENGFPGYFVTGLLTWNLRGDLK